METIKVYHLKDEAQYTDEHVFWAQQSYTYKLDVLERLRASWGKMENKAAYDDCFQGLRRVLRVVEQK